MELGAARFCRGSRAVHDEQVMFSRCVRHQLHELAAMASGASGVGAG